MKRNLYIILFTLLVVTNGCQHYLDVKPKGKLIPTQIADFDHLLDNIDIVRYPFLSNNSVCYLGHLTDNLTYSESLAEIAYLKNRSPNLNNYYAFTFRQPYGNPNTSDYFWDWGMYRSAKFFNNVIDGIEGLGEEVARSADAKAVMSQAYAGRAWAYFQGALVYGPVYQPDQENTEKTLPYVVDSDVSKPIPMISTQEEVFQKVWTDLHIALDGAPETTSYPSRPNKTATEAMLAYYHLFTQQYDSVLYYADRAWQRSIQNGVDQVVYDFNALSLADPQNPISSAITSPDNSINLPRSREILFFRATDQRAGLANDSYPSDSFIDLFDKENDLRFHYFFLEAPGYKTTSGGITYDDGMRIQYYRGATAGTTGTPKFQMTSGFTYPEVLLMRAEAYARTNRLSEAVADLNTLRRFRFKTGTPALSIPATQDEAILLVLEERRRELPIGHLKRFLDIKRYSLDTGKPWSLQTVEHVIGTNRYQGEVSSAHFRVHIVNPILRFNPHWEIPEDNRPY